MIKRIITTVGTSIFTNYMDKDNAIFIENSVSRGYRDIFSYITNLDEKKEVDRYKEEFIDDISNLLRVIKFCWIDKLTNERKVFKSCAELSTLQNIVKELLQLTNDSKDSDKEVTDDILPQEEKSEPTAVEGIEIYLFATDTILSVLAAKLLKEILTETEIEGVKVIDCFFGDNLNADNTTIIRGLNVHDADDFQKEGIQNLLKKIRQFATKEREHTILNISGGYKAIIPFLTLYAQLEEIPMKYQYEDSDVLITVGALPFSFDVGFGDIYFDYLTNDGLYKLNTSTPTQEIIEIRKILEDLGLIEKPEGLFERTTLGDVFKEYINPLSDTKKSNFGYFFELKVYQSVQLSQPESRILQGRKIWWYKDSNTYGDASKYNGDKSLERSIDIDLFIKQDNTTEYWCEAKSCSSTGLNKAKKQAENIVDFLRRTGYSPTPKYKLLLYKTDKVSLSDYQNNIRQIEAIFSKGNIECSVWYYNVPTDKRGLPNYKKLFETKTINFIEWKSEIISDN